MRRNNSKVTGRDSPDAFEKASFGITRQQRQEFRHGFFIGCAGNYGYCMQGLRHRGEGEKSGSIVIMNRPVPDGIAAEHKTSPVRIPPDNRIITDEPLKTQVVPSLYCR